MIQGQLPQEKTLRTSGGYNVTLDSADAGLPHIPYPSLSPLPGLSEPEPPNQLLLKPRPV